MKKLFREYYKFVILTRYYYKYYHWQTKNKQFQINENFQLKYLIIKCTNIQKMNF